MFDPRQKYKKQNFNGNLQLNEQNEEEEIKQRKIEKEKNEVICGSCRLPLPTK
jgi:hypothetical protein